MPAHWNEAVMEILVRFALPMTERNSDIEVTPIEDEHAHILTKSVGLTRTVILGTARLDVKLAARAFAPAFDAYVKMLSELLENTPEDLMTLHQRTIRPYASQ